LLLLDLNDAELEEEELGSALDVRLLLMNGKNSFIIYTIA
jgi:hypothetical protein